MSNLESTTTENLTNQDLDDDDDDQINSSHQIVPNIHKATKSGTNNSNFNVQNLIKNDLKIYLNTSIPKDYSGFIQCHIQREKQGLTKGFATIYTLYFDGQNQNDQKTFLLVARKHVTIGGHSEYFIGTNADNPTKNLTEENSVAKLKGINIIGTEYILYDHQNSSNQSAAIVYDNQIFASKEPRKFTVLLRDNQNNVQSSKENETIIEQWRSGHANNLIEIKNKSATYNEENKTYTLDLYDSRVKQPSHKNFQLITSNEDSENNVAMQFGRIDDNTFALDYRYPLTVVQAFAIALSSFHNRFHT